MTWNSEIKQLLDKHFQIRKEIFAASHQAYNGQESEALNTKRVDTANVQALYDRQDDYLKAISYSLCMREKCYIIDQFNNVLLNGISSFDGTAACNSQQTLEQFDSGDKDSYYGCLDQLRAQLALILARNDDDEDNNAVVIIDTNKFDQFRIAEHPELSRLLNEYFKIPRDMFIAWHGSEEINFEQLDALRAKQIDYSEAIVNYLDMRDENYIVDQFKYIVSHNIPDCYGQKMSEYFLAGNQDSYYSCLDQQGHELSLMLERDRDFMQNHNAIKTDSTHTSDEL